MELRDMRLELPRRMHSPSPFTLCAPRACACGFRNGEAEDKHSKRICSALRANGLISRLSCMLTCRSVTLEEHGAFAPAGSLRSGHSTARGTRKRYAPQPQPQPVRPGRLHKAHHRSFSGKHAQWTRRRQAEAERSRCGCANCTRRTASPTSGCSARRSLTKERRTQLPGSTTIPPSAGLSPDHEQKEEHPDSAKLSELEDEDNETEAASEDEKESNPEATATEAALTVAASSAPVHVAHATPSEKRKPR